MTEQGPDHDSDQPDASPVEPGTGEGVGLTMGEPNSFEPEEDPDADAGGADASAEG